MDSRLIDKDVRIAALERLVDDQAARIAQLESVLTVDFQPPAEWALPRRQAQIFKLLVARERLTKDAIFAVLWRDDNTVNGPSVVESHVSHLRKRLAPFGVKIESERHLGYRLVNRERYGRSA